jgi:type 1 glutamine amidotransferase
MMRVLVCLLAVCGVATAADPWIEYPGEGDGPGKGKKIVLVSGDEEYRSEEALPMLAKILSKHHGFTCTVLFAIDPKDGCINPNITNNIPGLEKLKDADLMVVFLRWRTLPDEQMKHFVEYVESGKPIIGLRTATHAIKPGQKGEYAKYGGSKDYEGGFGKQVLGETWVNHHGAHGKEGTRGIVAAGQLKHPILTGIKAGDIFGPTDVYTVNPLAKECVPLVYGEVTETLKPDSKAVSGKKNDPMMPVAWTKTYKTANDKTANVFTTTMGASQDLEYPGTRRMVINAAFWAVGLEDKITDKLNIDTVGEYKPTPFGFKNKQDAWKPGKTPAEIK